MPVRRLGLYFVTAAAMLVLAVGVMNWWAGGRDRNKPDARALVSADRQERAARVEATAAPGTELHQFPSRAFPAAAGNLFWTPEQIARPSAARAPSAPPSVQAPQTPPLPFIYLGRVKSGTTTTVILGRQNRERDLVARVGDTLDGTYRVEKIDETSMLLVYLPLGTQQSMPLAVEGAVARPPRQPGGSTAQTSGGQDSASLLHLEAPEQVSTGQDFVVNLSLLAGRKASVSVVYDPNVLSAIRRPAPGESTLSDRGRVLVDVVGPGFADGAAAPAAVRFRVIGAAPTTTQIQLEDITTTHDSDLRSLNVPAPRRIFVSSASAPR